MASTEYPSWLDEKLPSPEVLLERLQLLVPPQLDPDNSVRRLVAARVVFVLLYGYAIEGTDTWIRPTAVIDMSNRQSGELAPEVRRAWLRKVQSARRPKNIRGRWYSENSRETIRDEVLRRLSEIGIVVQRSGVTTTSPRPRYALARSVVAVFSPRLSAAAVEREIGAWRKAHLTRASLGRLALLRKGAAPGSERVRIELPNGEVRHLAPGPSSELARAVVEVFAPRFLAQPAVLLLSESAQKATYRDEELLRATGLRIEIATALPDLVLMDLEPNPPLLVFVECVATAGVVHEARRAALAAVAEASGYATENTAYVTAFADRADSPYRKNAAALAWGSCAWFASEPEHIILLRHGTEMEATRLVELLQT